MIRAAQRDGHGDAAPIALTGAMTAEVDLVQCESPTPAEMRSALGSFASGVTVVTGLDADEPVGFTCQSFASVSLEPPLVLFCADHRGRAWPRIRQAGRFCVNVLAEDQRDLCDRFGSSRGARFDGLEWESSPWGTPSLPSVLLRVHAQVESVHLAGDHDVVIGRVLALDTALRDSSATQRPMVFYRGGFTLEPGTDPRGSQAPRATGTAPLDETPLWHLDWGNGTRWG